MFLEVLLAWPGFLFICSTCLRGNVSSTRLQRWAPVLPKRLMFASPERLSSLSWIYILLTARSACQSKGKQSFLDLKELATSQQCLLWICSLQKYIFKFRNKKNCLWIWSQLSFKGPYKNPPGKTVCFFLISVGFVI